MYNVAIVNFCTMFLLQSHFRGQRFASYFCNKCLSIDHSMAAVWPHRNMKYPRRPQILLFVNFYISLHFCTLVTSLPLFTHRQGLICGESRQFSSWQFKCKVRLCVSRWETCSSHRDGNMRKLKQNIQETWFVILSLERDKLYQSGDHEYIWPRAVFLHCHSHSLLGWDEFKMATIRRNDR